MCAWCVAAGTQTAPLADGARGAGGRVACRRPGSPSRCLCPAGVRVHGAAQRLHDPHAARAQLRHHQVPLQQAISHLPQDAQGGVPAGHVAPLRLRGPQVSHGREQQLAPWSPAGTPAKSHSAFGAWSSNWEILPVFISYLAVLTVEIWSDMSPDYTHPSLPRLAQACRL